MIEQRVTVTGHGAIVDGRVITHPTAGGRGVGRYTVGFVRAMVDAGLDPLIAHTDDDQRRAWLDAIPGVRTVPLSPQAIRDAAERRAWFVCTQLMLHPVPLDVIPRAVTDAGLPVAAIIHDVIPQRHPERYLSDPNAAAQTSLRTILCRTIDLFCANSTFTADTAAIELGIDRSRFAVVGAAVEPQFTPGPAEPVLLERFGATCPGGPVVAVTGADTRKNTDRLIAAWAKTSAVTRRRHRLVVACAAPSDVIDHWRHLAVVAGVGDGVVFTGAIDDTAMVGLMRSAVLTVLPSIEEGFGLPIAESVACGTPAVNSRTSSMPEVSGSADAEFDPFDIDDMAGAIDAALSDPERRDRILLEQRSRAQRWTSHAVGRLLSDALATTVRRTPGSLPVRVAVAAPHPRSPSGIGPYTAAVLAHWPDQASLLVLDETSVTDLVARPAGEVVPAASVSALGRSVRAHDVDHLVAVLGSSAHHAVTLERSHRGRCHLWMHEPTVVGALLGPAHLGGDSRWLRDRLLSLGLDPVAATIDPMATELPDPATLHSQDHMMLGPLIAGARSMIVSSEEAARIVAASIAPEVAPPMLVLPLGHPPVSATVGRHDGDFRRVISLGWIDAGKEPDALLALVAALDGSTLDLVGGGAPDELDRLRALAAQLDIATRVRIHGRVDDAERDTLIAAADVAIQLRTGRPGQMSAAVTELLAAGVPVVTTLSTHGASGDGLITLEGGPGLAERLIAEVGAILDDPGARERHRTGAFARAQQWGMTDVAMALHHWLTTVDDHRPGSVTHAAVLR